MNREELDDLFEPGAPVATIDGRRGRDGRTASVTFRQTEAAGEDAATLMDPAAKSLADALRITFRLLQLAMVVLLYLLYRTRLGMATRAVSQQPIAAQLVGIRLDHINALTFIITGMLGGFAGAGIHVHVMNLTGLVMMALFLHLYFAPWRRMRRALDAGDNVAAGRELAQIRTIVAINLGLGLITAVIGASGRYWG